MSKFKNFIEWPSQEEAPLMAAVSRIKPKKLQIPQAKLGTVFMAQSLDHGLTYLMCTFFLSIAFSLFDGLLGPDFFSGLGTSFWLGLCGFVFLLGVFGRFISFYFFGASAGAHYMKVQVFLTKPSLKTLSLVYIWESIEGAIPGLWFLSTILRLSEAQPGVSYIYRNL